VLVSAGVDTSLLDEEEDSLGPLPEADRPVPQVGLEEEEEEEEEGAPANRAGTDARAGFVPIEISDEEDELDVREVKVTTTSRTSSSSYQRLEQQIPGDAPRAVDRNALHPKLRALVDRAEEEDEDFA
jgi:hypothetical protein